jgi:pilus assembly protein CpaE
MARIAPSIDQLLTLDGAQDLAGAQEIPIEVLDVDAPHQADHFPSPAPAEIEAPIEAAPVFESLGMQGDIGVGVPPISIHMFYADADTAAVGEAALRDRRLGRAAGAIFAGGLTAALEWYKSHPTPSLVIVESLETESALFEGLNQLSQVCDPSTKVMVVGRANDVALYRDLVRRGVSEYLVGPLQPLQLIEAVSGLYQNPASPFAGRTIAVIGAKGGVGASVVAHNLAYAFSQTLQANTVLVDLDLPFGAAGLNFNQDPLQGVADALAQPDRLDPVLLERMMVRCGERLSLFASPANLENDYDVEAAAYAEVLSKIKGAAPFVVLDLPHLWSGWVRQTLLWVDDVLVVATPELASLRNAKNMIDLIIRGRPNDAPPRLVLNQVGLAGRPEISVKDFADGVGLEPDLVLPFDAKLFGQAANNGQMIAELSPKAKTAEGLGALACRIGGREPVVAPVKAASLLAGLFKPQG